jgi:electron transport complex protein RnfG
MKIGEIARPAIVLLVVCIVMTLVLAATYGATKGPIEQGAIDRANQVRRDFFPEASEFAKIEYSAEGITDVYAAKAQENILGYIISAYDSGYGGHLEIMAGIGIDGAVKAVRLTSDNETPGLGKNAAQDFFISQYAVLPAGEFNVVKSNKSKDEEILSLAGATITSRAVTDAVNAAYRCFSEIGGGTVVK